jgi:sec-independent protein translocase protein TatB
MMGIGFAEFMVIGLVALLVFGPDRLPEFARQAGRFVRQVRTFSRQARDDIRAELGPEYADFELTDLDPRRAIRKHIVEAWDEEGEDGAPTPQQRRSEPPLRAGELPPYDPDAT